MHGQKTRGGVKEVRPMDSFRVTDDQKIFLGEKEIVGCVGFKVCAKAGDDPEVELRVIVENVDIENYRAVPTQKESRT